MDFADSCLVLLAEKLGINTVATIDRDFSIYRIKGKKAFKTVLVGIKSSVPGILIRAKTGAVNN